MPSGDYPSAAKAPKSVAADAILCLLIIRFLLQRLILPAFADSVSVDEICHRVGLELPILALIPGLSYVAWRPASDIR